MDATSQPALRPLSLNVQTLADDFAPPRASYVLFIPALLACTGAVSWMMSNPQGMVLAGLVGSAVALFSLWDWIYREAPTRFSTLLGMSLLLGYAVGAMNTWITLPRGSLTLSAIFSLQPGILARGLGAVLMSAAILYCLGEMFEKPLFTRTFQFHFDERTRVLIYLGALAMLGGYATHAMGFAGITSHGGRVSAFGSALSWAYSPLTALSVASLLSSRTKAQRILSAVSTLIYVLMLSVLGRGVTIYTTVMVLWVLPHTGYRLRGFNVKKVVMASILGGVVVISALTFMLLRIAGYSVRLNGQQQASVRQRIEVANKLVQEGQAYKLAARASQTNFQTRTFILAFFSNILDASSRMTPALGKDAEGLFQVAIPHVIDPGKNAFFAEEQLDDAQFGFSYGDQANSVLTAGATDFGFIGVLIYPLLLVLLFRLFYEFFAPYTDPTTRIIGALALIDTFLMTEDTLTGYFVSLRSTLLFGVLIAVFMKLPSFKLHSPSETLR